MTSTPPETLHRKRIQQRNAHRVKATLGFVVFTGIVILGWHLVTTGYDDGGLAPTPGATWQRLLEVVSTAFVYNPPNDFGIIFHLLASLQRVVVGFLFAAIIAIPLGLVLGTNRVLHDALDPIVQVLRPVSPLAWLPVGLALLRDSESTAIFVIFMASLWIILINTIDGVHRVNPLYLDLARTLEATWTNRTFKVILPAAFPGIVTGLRTALSTAWLVIVAAEMIVGNRGMGTFVWNEWNAMNINSIMVAIVIIGLIGLVLDRSIAQLHRLIPKN
jgi:nitrate/nitrite transport system permease protein